MKYCEDCKVYVSGGLDNCPLCGSYLSEKESGCERYRTEIEPYVSYPELKLRGDANRNFLRKKSLLLTALAVAACLVINFLLTPKSLWSLYVAVGGFVAYTLVFTTIYTKRRFYSLIALSGVIIPASLYMFDMIQSFNATGNLALFGISNEFLVPAFLIALIITDDVMIFTEKSGYKYYVLALLSPTITGLAPQITVWLLTGTRFIWWLSFALFFFAIVNALVIFIIYWANVKSESVRKFFL